MRAIGIVMILLITGCATRSSLSGGRSEEETLSQRATGYWEAKQKNDWERVKEFVDPGLRKDLAAYFDSMKNQRAMSEIISYDIQEIRPEGETSIVVANLKLKLTHPLLGSPQDVEQKIKDRWVKKSGVWYVVIARPDLSKVLEELGKNGKGGDN
jgi:hypothetical protein